MSFEALLAARFKTEPWPHQYAEFERHALAPARALIWQMRTGKTKETLDEFCAQLEAGLVDTLVIFAPNGVHANWIDRELPLHLWDGIDAEALAWRTKIAGLKPGGLVPKVTKKAGGLDFESHRTRLSRADKAEWEEAHASWWSGFWHAVKGAHPAIFSFNSESMTRDDIRRALANIMHRRKVFMVWDESTDFRTPSSKRTFMARALARRAITRRILDGTMLHQSPLNAFAQFELLDKAALGYAEHAEFQARYAEMGQERRGRRMVPVLVGLKHLEELRASIARYSSVVLREDVNLPPLPRTPKPITLSAEQERVYREVEKQIRIEVERDEVVSIGAQVSKILKLQQVVGGWLIDEDGTKHRIPGRNPRLESLSSDVYYASGKVIVWCQFRHEIEEVATRLRLDGHEVMEYHGGVSDEDRAYVRTRFPHETEKVVLVGQPQSAGRGLELPAGLILWYSHTFNTIIRAQADERATVMGGNRVNIVDYIAPGVDGYILDRVTQNISIADDVAGRGLKAILRELQRGD